MKRSPLVRRQIPLRPVSRARAAENRRRKPIREAVFARDGGCVIAGHPEVGPCHGPLTPHHLLKASHGGLYTTTNLTTLCAHHNGWVEDNPVLARRLGLVWFSWEAP